MSKMIHTLQRAISDSSLTVSEILKQNPRSVCPDEVTDDLRVFEVQYYSFDNRIHAGQIAAHKDLVEDIQDAFSLLLAEKFPIQSVIPISDDTYRWDDSLSTGANNCSSFNYRYVRDTEELSNHATGRAIDINPKFNPYFPGTQVFPVGCSYDPAVRGTILSDSNLVSYFKNRGWAWGGDWTEDPDYHHFEKM